jgi:hypothetical protein
MITGLKRGHLVGYLVAIFVAGAVAGAAGGFEYGRRSMFRPPRGPGDGGKSMRERFAKELELTSEQLRQVEPILIETWEKIHVCQKDAWRQVGALVKESNERIRPFLTEPQRAKLTEMENRRHGDASKAKDGKPPGPPPDAAK